MAAANAGYNETVTTAEEDLFRCIDSGGTQKNGVTSITVQNKGAAKAYLNVGGLMESTEYFELDSGAVVTFRVLCDAARPMLQIPYVTAKTLAGSTTLAWGATERR